MFDYQLFVIIGCVILAIVVISVTGLAGLVACSTILGFGLIVVGLAGQS